MYEWLDKELAEIRTRRFHVVDGAASEELHAAVRTSPLPAPPSYVSFVLRFGNAKLYRETDLDSYMLHVFAAPRHVERVGALEPAFHIGGYDEGCAYLREELLGRESESPVFESAGPRLLKVATTFEEWVTTRAARARKTYTKAKWAAVLRGPEPFTDEELAIIEARRGFSWRVVGVTLDREIRYEVTNGSDRRLPFLSIGVRGTNLQGGVWLPVGHIEPGQTAVVAKATYRELLDPSEVIAFALPDPEPEERARYWEFRVGALEK